MSTFIRLRAHCGQDLPGDAIGSRSLGLRLLFEPRLERPDGDQDGPSFLGAEVGNTGQEVAEGALGEPKRPGSLGRPQGEPVRQGETRRRLTSLGVH